MNKNINVPICRLTTIHGGSHELLAKEVTSFESVALQKSMIPPHCARVNTFS